MWIRFLLLDPFTSVLGFVIRLVEGMYPRTHNVHGNMASTNNRAEGIVVYVFSFL
jgi:hypothetical protein